MMESQSQDNETTGEVPKTSQAFVVSKQGILGVLTWCLAHRKSMQKYSYFSIIFIKCPGNHLEIRWCLLSVSMVWVHEGQEHPLYPEIPQDEVPRGSTFRKLLAFLWVTGKHKYVFAQQSYHRHLAFCGMAHDRHLQCKFESHPSNFAITLTVKSPCRFPLRGCAYFSTLLLSWFVFHLLIDEFCC